MNTYHVHRPFERPAHRLPSLLGDVLGPVGRGSSSSHTMGPERAARMVRLASLALVSPSCEASLSRVTS
jgi:hypothetical protein